MKDDAWQTCILSQHQQSCGVGVGVALVPRASYPLASCPHQGLLNIQEVLCASMPGGALDKPLPPSRPQFLYSCH